MQNSGVFNFKEKNKQQVSTGANSSSTASSNGEKSFIDYILFDQRVFGNPYNCDQRAMEVFFQRIQVKKIKIKKLYMDIIVLQNYENQNIKKLNFDEMKWQNKKLKEQLNFIDAKVSKEFPLYKQKVLQYPTQFNQKKYQQWVKQMGNANFISLFLPILGSSTCLKSFTISHKTMALMGYTFDEGALQIQKYRFNGLSFFDNYAYHIISLSYINTFVKFIEAELRGTLTKEQVIAESQTYIANEMVGKNQRRIKVEMKIFMPSPFIICCLILNISRGEKYHDQSLQAQRTLIDEYNNKKYKNQLHHIIKFPKSPPEHERNKVCSYSIIRNED